jgi:sucrose-6-phosphatase
MTRPLLLCTDLDRTLIPNGTEPESVDARPRFRRFTANPGITLAYVSGRHQALVRQAIAEHDLPEPDVVIGDVGTSIFIVRPGRWEPMADWQQEIGRDWGGIGPDRLAELFSDIRGSASSRARETGAIQAELLRARGCRCGRTEIADGGPP